MRFGVLCNGTDLQQWQLETIRILVSGGHSCSLLIVNANTVSVPGFRQKLVTYPYSKLLYRVWFRYMIKPEAKKAAAITDLYKDIPVIECRTIKKGYSEYFDEKDVDSIKALDLDFILRFGFGIIKGGILEAAKYGVWSYHHDDDRKYRGVPTGFWEIMFGDPVNAAILQRLTNKLDSGVILYKAFFATINHSWQANLNNLLQSSTEWPLQVCRRIENEGTGFLSSENFPESEIYKLPDNLRMIKFLFKVAFNKFKFHYRDLFLTEKWKVGIIDQPAEKLIKPGSYTIPKPLWLNTGNRKSVYHADSFGILKNDKYLILCEEFDYRKAKGIIVSLTVDKKTKQVLNKTTVLEPDHHLAYPYLFENDGKLYCIPENSEAGNVDLYRFLPSEGKLVFERTLIPNLQAVDPTIFFYNGYWWLFFTDRVSTNERIHIWYSLNLEGPFTPHANNPVKVDIRSSRPAGNLFVLDGKLMRPAQDCSIRSGRRICINQIITLTPECFVEAEYSILNPDPGSDFYHGMHTFCVSGDQIIVDGKRECFIWQAFIRKLSGKIKKII